MPLLKGPTLRLLLPVLLLSLCLLRGAEFNVRDHGAKGDGVAVDSPAINAAIEAACAAGGGVVRIPAGKYLSFSIRLKSNVSLVFDPGSVLLAGDPASGLGSYDETEDNPHDLYQDFGHSHWRNSLIWGENLENVSLVGPGLIDGAGLTRRGPPARKATGPETQRAASMQGQGNKAISLKLCRNVILRDLSLYRAGHFALLATGVDNLTLDNLKVDTNRDGFDIDGCRNVRISNCSVNSPNDDAIVLKASYALGFLRDCENITITNSFVSGFDLGSLLDASFRKTQALAPDRDGVTGRIKIGTESNGSFRNIVISNCVFNRSRGLAIETVDGGTIEDLSVTNITMRDIMNSPLFVRLGNRARGPEGTAVGAIRRISISNITVHDADSRYSCLISGIPGHPIEDLRIENIRIHYKGGLSLREAAEQPQSLTNSFFQRSSSAKTEARQPLDPARDAFAVPEREEGYPEPSMFGLLPASVFYIRHAKDISLVGSTFTFEREDSRPALVLNDVKGITLSDLSFPESASRPALIMTSVDKLRIRDCSSLPNSQLNSVPSSQLP